MSRATRRHPSAKQRKERGRSQGRALPRTGATTRQAARGEGRSGVAAALGWRPRFLMDIINELRKVVWPSREEATHLTFVVAVVTVLIGAALGGIDIGFGWLIDNTILR